jgi:hypothetical protein
MADHARIQVKIGSRGKHTEGGSCYADVWNGIYVHAFPGLILYSYTD